MADELDSALNEPSEVERRIKDLSGKVRTAAEERDAAKNAQVEAEGKVAEAQRERDFYASFSDVVADNPSAKDFKDDILSKVKSGYTVEDATFAVLGKAGKLNQPKEETTHIAGGSAVNSPTQGEKKISEMTRDEKYAALIEAEKRGDISLT